MKKEKAPASFFFTGRFYRNGEFIPAIKRLKKHGHYLGAHSDQHLLYCDWTKRDSLLVTRQQFAEDLQRNYEAMALYGLKKPDARYFLPPYEWYNDTIAAWTRNMGMQLVNFSPGTRSHADYTVPAHTNYITSDAIMESVLKYEEASPTGLNGFILLLHAGTDPARTDKFYYRLHALISALKQRGYHFFRIDHLLEQ